MFVEVVNHDVHIDELFDGMTIVLRLAASLERFTELTLVGSGESIAYDP